MIKIIDYNIGNVRAFLNVYQRLNIPVSIARTAADLQGATQFILPGVGSFDKAMRSFNESGLREGLTELVLQEQIPILGICVGMQMLADNSDEGQLPGLGWIKGRVKNMKALSAADEFILPHMGWNNVYPQEPDNLFCGLEQDARFYFLHSYYYECENPSASLAKAEYGQQFTCSVRHHNIYGVQFHPEKSHHYGARLLSNFAEL